MKLLTIVGARPQFIKAAALSRAIKASNGDIQEKILHTGQHYDVAMSHQFFEELGIPAPAFNLGIGGGSHGANTGRMLEAIEQILLEQPPDALLVYGDTDSTLAGTLAASKLKIPVVHVEAGLRSFNRHQPEEQNRVLTDHLSQLCFAPTETAVGHLQREGIPQDCIVRTGDVMADVARIFGEEVEEHAGEILRGRFGRNSRSNQPYVLATIHRAETLIICSPRVNFKALALVATNGIDGHDPLPVLLPLHPRTKTRLETYQLQPLLEPLTLMNPLGFFAMLLLERRASIVLTDSGGVQKEAFLQSTPCVTIRTETEWVELLECGWNQLADPGDSSSIIKAVGQQLFVESSRSRPPLYGDGHAAEEIVARLMQI